MAAEPAPPEDPAPDPSADPWVGRTLGGHYRLVERLGVGAMGTVYRARHTLLDRDFAVKVLHGGEGSVGDVGASRPGPASAEVRRRFLVESESLSSFTHRNAVAVRHCGDEGGLLYLAMDLAPGRTLEALLAEVGALPVRRAAAIAVQILEALDEAHAAGIVHRDLKPANVMVDEARDDRVCVLDFGLARLLPGRVDGGPEASAARRVVGTVAYMAPEQALAEPIDARADVYAVGVLLSEMVTGRGERPAPALAAVIARATALRPDDRFASAGQMAEALRAAVPRPAPPAAPTPRDGPPRAESGAERATPRRRLARRRWILGAAGALAATLAAVAAVSASSKHGRAPAASDRVAKARAEGEVALLTGQPAQAVAAFSSALRAVPSDLDALVGRARARIVLRDRGALGDIDEAARVAGDLPHLAVLRARYLAEVDGNLKAGLAELSRALWTHPGDLEVRATRARLALTVHDVEGGRTDVEAVEAAAPGSATALALRARYLRVKSARTGRSELLDGALQAARAARRADPDGAEAAMEEALTLCALAIASEYRRDVAASRRYLGEAHRSADEAVALARSHPAHVRQGASLAYLHFERAGLLTRAGRPDLALVGFDAALALAPRDALARKHRGVALQELGRYRESIDDLERAYDVTQEADPLFRIGFAWQRLGEQAADRGDDDGARALLDRALEVYDGGLLRFPDAPDLRAYRGETKTVRAMLAPEGPERTAGLASAREDLDAVLEERPKDGETLLRRGEWALAAGRTAEALDMLRRARAGRPDPTPRYFTRLAEAALARAGETPADEAATAARLDEAVEAATRALELRPELAAAPLLLRATALARRGHLDRARADVTALEALAAGHDAAASDPEERDARPVVPPSTSSPARIRALAAWARAEVAASEGDLPRAAAEAAGAVAAREEEHRAGRWRLDPAWYLRLAAACDAAGDVEGAARARARVPSLR